MLVSMSHHPVLGSALNPIATIVKAYAYSFALNAIQQFALAAAADITPKSTFTWENNADEAKKKIPGLVAEDPFFSHLATKCEKAFQAFSLRFGFDYCNWLTICDVVGAETCMSNSFTRDAALQILEHKMVTVLPDKMGDSKYAHIEDCFLTSDCPDIDENNIHPRSKKATEAIFTAEPLETTPEQMTDWLKRIWLPYGWKRSMLTEWLSGVFVPPEWRDVQEILRFRSDDPREKFLFISAESDHNNALDPTYIADMLSKLSQTFDLKFQVVKKAEHICNAIENGKKTGNLAHVLINGHGRPDNINLDSQQVNVEGGMYMISQELTTNFDYAKCFSGVQPNGKILLLSCSTGKPQNDQPFDNIAQKIADGAKRVVVAPTKDVYMVKTQLLSAEEGALFHPDKRLYSFLPFFNTNAFTTFRPLFQNCLPKIDINNLPQRELDAVTVIKKELIAKELLHKDATIDETVEYLQVCKDDPRPKALFLAGEYDKNQAMDPQLSSKILSVFADRFDLRYKVIKSFDEICKEVEQAAKTGNVVTVVIKAHGTPKEGMILSKNLDETENRITAANDFSNCFSKMQEDGTIVLMGGSQGQKTKNTIKTAQKIANESKRTVLASTCRVYPDKTTVQSINPVVLNHPGYPIIKNFFYEGCPENGDNLFKTFNPSSPKTKPEKEL